MYVFVELWQTASFSSKSNIKQFHTKLEDSQDIFHTDLRHMLLSFIDPDTKAMNQQHVKTPFESWMFNIHM